jgi:predicted nucleotidyltransferase component of viral defense system
VLERLLYHLSQTPHRDRFALKGAMLITTWFDDPLRPTRDLDLLGFGDPDPQAMIHIFQEVCAVKADDGVEFDVAALQIDRIREELEYGGLRIKTTATTGGAKIRVAIDIGFGDAVEPAAVEVELPVLLDFPTPRLRAYARETVIAEKFQALVMLGRANRRMKDLYDIWVLSRSYNFTGDSLARAIAATFARRKTEIPSRPPDALGSDETYPAENFVPLQRRRFRRLRKEQAIYTVHSAPRPGREGPHFVGLWVRSRSATTGRRRRTRCACGGGPVEKFFIFSLSQLGRRRHPQSTCWPGSLIKRPPISRRCFLGTGASLVSIAPPDHPRCQPRVHSADLESRSRRPQPRRAARMLTSASLLNDKRNA